MSTTHAARGAPGATVYDSAAVVSAYRRRRAIRRAIGGGAGPAVCGERQPVGVAVAPVEADARAVETSAAGHQAWADPVAAGALLGRRLRRHLATEAPTSALVLAMPGHGVQVAAAVAAVLDADLDVVLTRALRAGTDTTPALVAVAAAGAGVDLVRPRPLTAEEAATAFADDWPTAIADLLREQGQWRAGSPARPLRARTVVIATDVLEESNAPQVRGAVQALRRHRPARVVVAACATTLAPGSDLHRDADAVVITWVPLAAAP